MKVHVDGNELKLSFQKALKRMIQTFIHILHLKMLVCQLDYNRNLMLEPPEEAYEGDDLKAIVA
jgi:hypothetical protein